MGKDVNLTLKLSPKEANALLYAVDCATAGDEDVEFQGLRERLGSFFCQMATQNV